MINRYQKKPMSWREVTNDKRWGELDHLGQDKVRVAWMRQWKDYMSATDENYDPERMYRQSMEAGFSQHLAFGAFADELLASHPDPLPSPEEARQRYKERLASHQALFVKEPPAPEDDSAFWLDWSSDMRDFAMTTSRGFAGQFAFNLIKEKGDAVAAMRRIKSTLAGTYKPVGRMLDKPAEEASRKLSAAAGQGNTDVRDLQNMMDHHLRGISMIQDPDRRKAAYRDYVVDYLGEGKSEAEKARQRAGMSHQQALSYLADSLDMFKTGQYWRERAKGTMLGNMMDPDIQERLGEFNYGDLVPGKGWWTTNGLQQLWTTGPLMLVNLAGGVVAGPVLGGFIGGAMEAAAEAGGVYATVLELSGGDRMKAMDAADSSFVANTAWLTVSNMVQLEALGVQGTKMLPQPLRTFGAKRARVLSQMFKKIPRGVKYTGQLLFQGISEGLEETMQETYNDAGIAYGMGEAENVGLLPIGDLLRNFGSPQYQEAFFGGFLMGGLFGAFGAVSDEMVRKDLLKRVDLLHTQWTELKAEAHATGDADLQARADKMEGLLERMGVIADNIDNLSGDEKRLMVLKASGIRAFMNGEVTYAELIQSLRDQIDVRRAAALIEKTGVLPMPDNYQFEQDAEIQQIADSLVLDVKREHGEDLEGLTKARDALLNPQDEAYAAIDENIRLAAADILEKQMVERELAEEQEAAATEEQQAAQEAEAQPQEAQEGQAAPESTPEGKAPQKGLESPEAPARTAEQVLAELDEHTASMPDKADFENRQDEKAAIDEWLAKQKALKAELAQAQKTQTAPAKPKISKAKTNKESRQTKHRPVIDFHGEAEARDRYAEEQGATPEQIEYLHRADELHGVPGELAIGKSFAVDGFLLNFEKRKETINNQLRALGQEVPGETAAQAKGFETQEEAVAAMVERLEAHRKRGDIEGEEAVTAEEVGVTEAPNKKAKAAAAVAERAFGVRVVWVAPTSQRLQGHFWGAYIGNTIFLSTAMKEDALTTVTGHELWHTMKEQAPELAQKWLDKALKLPEVRAILQKYAKEQGLNLDDASQREEAEADLFGVIWARPEVQKAMAKQDLSLAARVAEFIQMILEQIEAFISGTEISKSELTDLSDAVQHFQNLSDITLEITEQYNQRVAEVEKTAGVITKPFKQNRDATSAEYGWHGEIDGKPVHIYRDTDQSADHVWKLVNPDGTERTLAFTKETAIAKLQAAAREAAAPELSRRAPPRYRRESTPADAVLETFYPTIPDLEAIEGDVKAAARRYGWTPQQVNAALATSVQMRMPALQNEIKQDLTYALRKGWVSKSPEGFYDWTPAGHEEVYKRLRREIGNGRTGFAKEAYEFNKIWRDLAIQVSLETVPGVESGRLPGIHGAPYQQLVEYHQARMKVMLDANGENVLAKMMGLRAVASQEAAGAWKLENNPSRQEQVYIGRVSFNRAREEMWAEATRLNPENRSAGMITLAEQYGIPTVDATTGEKRSLTQIQHDLHEKAYGGHLTDDVKKVIEAYAAAIAYIYDQEGVGYHKAIWESGIAPADAEGGAVILGRPLTLEETKEIYAELIRLSGIDDFAPIGTDYGANFLNGPWTGVDNETFHGYVKSALGKIWSANPERAVYTHFAKDGDLIGGTEDALRSKITEAFGPDVFTRVNRLRQQAREIDASFAERYGWDQAADIAGEEGAVGGDVQGTRGRGEGADVLRLRPPVRQQDGQVELTHWSPKANLQTIDPAFHGTGIKGAEAARKHADPETYPERTYYGYGDYRKEPGLGSNRYTVAVSPGDLYDIHNDPDNLSEDARLIIGRRGDELIRGPVDITQYERRIKEAGYRGFFNDQMQVAALFDAQTPEAVVNERELTDVKFRKPVTPRQDADYLQAVEAGDMETAQRMVDEAAKAAGYNVGPVYHGTDERFTVFENRGGKVVVLFSTFDVDRQGFFFTNDEVNAAEFGKRLMSVYLRSNNPAELDANYQGVLNEVFDEIDESWYRKPGEFGNTWEMFDDAEGKHFVDVLRRHGYDSATFQEDNPSTGEPFDVTVVFSPEQIKSSDPVTYDDAGNVIPLSERFQPEEADIRFRKPVTVMEPNLLLQAGAEQIMGGNVLLEDWRDAMIRQYGDVVRPVLSNLWQYLTRDSHRNLKTYQKTGAFNPRTTSAFSRFVENKMVRFAEMEAERQLQQAQVAGERAYRSGIMEERRVQSERRKKRDQKAAERVARLSKLITTLRSKRDDLTRKQQALHEYVNQVLPPELRGRLMAKLKNLTGTEAEDIIRRHPEMSLEEAQAYGERDLEQALQYVDELWERHDHRQAQGEVLDAIRQLRQFGLDHLSPSLKAKAEEVLDTFTVDNIGEKRLARLRETIDFMERNPDNPMPDSVLKEVADLSKMPVREMTSEDVRALADTIRGFVNQQKLINSLRKNLKNRTIRQAVDDVAKAVKLSRNQIDPDQLPAGVEALGSEFKGSLTDRNRAWTLPPFALAYLMDGSKEGAVTEILVNSLREGQRRHHRLIRDVTETVRSTGVDVRRMSRSFYSPLTRMFFNKWGQNIGLDGGPEFNTETINGREVKLTKGDRIAIYLHSLNPDNLRHLTRGGFVFRFNRTANPIIPTIDDVQRIAEGVQSDPELARLAQTIADVFDGEIKNSLNETSLEINGFDIATVTNYFPLMVASEWRHHEMPDEVTMNDMRSFQKMTIEGIGIVKKRQAGASGAIVLEDAFEAMSRVTRLAANYHGFASPLRDVKAVLRGAMKDGTPLQSVMVQTWGRSMYNSFTDLVEKIETGGAGADRVDSLSNRILNNITKAILAYNLPVSGMQAVSYVTAGFMIPHEHWMHGLKSQAASYEEMGQHSPFLYMRGQGHVSIAMGEAMEASGARKMWLGNHALPIGERGMQAIQFMDRQAIGRIWRACESWAEADGFTPGTEEYFDEVSKRTENIIVWSQPSYDLIDRPRLARSRNYIAKVLMRFTSQRIKNRGLKVRAWSDMKTGQADAKQTAQRMALMYLIVPAMIATIQNLRGRLYGYDEDEDKNFWGYVADIAQVNISDLPPIGGMLGDFDINDPLLQNLNNYRKLTKRLLDADKYTASELGATLELGGKAVDQTMGWGLNNIYRLFKAMVPETEKPPKKSGKKFPGAYR